MVSLLLLKSGATAFDSSEVNVPMIRTEFYDYTASGLSAAHKPAEYWLCLLHFSLENGAFIIGLLYTPSCLSWEARHL